MWNNYNATNANDTVKKTCTFTARNNATYVVYFATAASSNNLTLTEYQMEEGSTATAYQPHSTMLPSGYTPLEYLMTTGTQYIDTGITANEMTEINAEVSFGSVSSGTTAGKYIIIGVRNGSDAGTDTFMWGAAVGKTYNRFGIGTTSSDTAISANVLYNVSIRNGFQILKNSNGDTIAISKVSYRSSLDTATLYMFCAHDTAESTGTALFAANGTYIKKLRISNSGVMQRDFVPARRDSDGELGMYDIVTGTFFTNLGTGAFVGGPIIAPACTDVGAGYYSSASTVNYGSGGVRNACPVGTYSNVINATSATTCTACANATYNDTPAASACKACPTGYDYNTATGKTSASQCQIQCPAGTWNGEYTQLEYIEGSGTQYIDTGIVLTSDTNEIKVLTNLSFVSLAVNATHLLYVSSPGSGVQVYLNNGKVYNQGVSQLIFANVDYLVETTTTETQRKLAINGEQEQINEFVRSISDGASLYSIGGSSTGAVRAKWKYQKIYKNGVLVRDFIPVRRNVDNVIGMYDTVTGTFFTNSGTGTFTAGPDVAQGLCMNVGMGYYAPASVMNLGSVGIRNACPAGTTTVGYGHGADSANDCGRTLHVGDNVLYMRKNKETSPALHIQMENGDIFYVNLSPTNHNMSKMHLWHNGAEYTAYDDSLFYNERDFITGASIAQ